MARTITISGEGEESGDEEKWDTVGKKAFRGEKGAEVRREVVEGVLSGGGTGGWCDEQVSISKSLPLRTIHLVSRRNLRWHWGAYQTTVLRHFLAHLQQAEEDWEGAALTLMGIPLEGGSRWAYRAMTGLRRSADRPRYDSWPFLRLISDEEKLAVYIQIVRLLLEVSIVILFKPISYWSQLHERVDFLCWHGFFSAASLAKRRHTFPEPPFSSM